jgi:hypothetical protein
MSNNNKDKWDKKLDDEIDTIRNCQLERQLTGCEDCDQLLICKIRKKYVKAVYESMNKGTTGGFEF